MHFVLKCFIGWGRAILASWHGIVQRKKFLAVVNIASKWIRKSNLYESKLNAKRKKISLHGSELIRQSASSSELLIFLICNKKEFHKCRLSSSVFLLKLYNNYTLNLYSLNQSIWHYFIRFFSLWDFSLANIKLNITIYLIVRRLFFVGSLSFYYKLS